MSSDLRLVRVSPARQARGTQAFARRVLTRPTRAPGRTLATGLAAIDDATGGGLPLGDVTEIVRSDPICGSRLLLGQLLAVTHASRTHVG